MRLVLLPCLGLMLGCAASRSSTRFTSENELKQVMAQPKPAKVFTEGTIAIDSWELVGPLPETTADGPHETGSLFAKVLLDTAATKGFRASEPLACVARQLGRFLALKGARAPSALRTFMSARCGVTTPGVGSLWLTGKAPTDTTNEALLTRWKEQVEKLASQVSAGERAGIAFVREGEQVVVAIAHVRDHTDLEPVSLKPDANGFVWVRGVSTRKADTIFGTANQGRAGTADCVDTQTRAAPAFELKCPVAKDDAAAWISVSAREKGRVLGYEVVRVLAMPSGAPVTTWTAPSLVAAAPGATPGDFIAQLNSVRSQLGARPLTLSDAQSNDLRELAPFYFEAMLKDDDALEDKLALGVMAGWRVDQEIMHGSFAASFGEATTVSELLSSMLDSPGYRRDLLSARAGVLAVGLLQEGPVLAALVSTYDPIQPPTWPATADKVLTALNGQRQRNGKKPVQWVLLPSSSEPTYAEAVTKREYDSETALEKFMSVASTTTQRPVRGWRIPAVDLDDINWPDEVLSKDSLEVLFVVASERNPKDAWGQYVLLLVILEGASQPQT
ncbi:MAG: hypothetical protein JNJ54_15690 [Myxococcaceae bacterium]|nr:hypothetical protein [Myxococcaceae bacterium]